MTNGIKCYFTYKSPSHDQQKTIAKQTVSGRALGRGPKAVVVLRRGAGVTEEQLIDHCRERLARFKAPKQVVFVKELPKTGSGKILKVKLREFS